MRYLIDGYNLLHALGLARKDGGRAGWDGARAKLLDWLADRHADSPGDVIIALDAQTAYGTNVVVQIHRGLHVLHKPGASADDLIEELLAEETSPGSLTVVSNDNRIRSAAKQSRCNILKCGEYVDNLMSRQKQFANESTPEKDETATASEMAAWMKAFE